VELQGPRQKSVPTKVVWRKKKEERKVEDKWKENY
jgi:hypothetical protein